jgi:hypothetical protein
VPVPASFPQMIWRFKLEYRESQSGDILPTRLSLMETQAGK